MIYHFWHPDQGYQKAKINNTVFKQIDPQRYPVLICIDHDVILHPRFVEDHFREHAKDQFKPLLFMGRRVDLSEQLTAQLTVDNVNGFTSRLSLKLLKSILKKETKHGLRSLRIDLPPFFSTLFKRDRVYDLLGSNYSIQTQALLDVNGYNEDYRSYWGEDGDLFVRVRNSRIPIRGKIGYAVQWHLYHQRLEETQAHVEQYQRLLLDTQYCRCKNGITKT